MAKVRRKHRRPDWMDSLVAPFIRKVLRCKTDAERNVVVGVLADWLDEHGDVGGNAAHFRNPRLRWEKAGYGDRRVMLSWFAPSPLGPGRVLTGTSGNIETHWWTIDYPTPQWLASPKAERLVSAWLNNRVDFRENRWVEAVAIRMGWEKAYRMQVAEMDRRDEDARERERLKEVHDKEAFARLLKKYGCPACGCVAAPPKKQEL